MQAMARLAGILLLVLTAVLTLACQQPEPVPVAATATPVVIRVTATPDVSATLTAEAEAPTNAPVPTPTPAPLPTNTPAPATTPPATPTPTLTPTPTVVPTATPIAVRLLQPATATPTPLPTPALSPDPLALTAVKGNSQMFKPVVGDGGSQIAVEVSPGVGDLSVLLPELDCAEPRNTLDVSGNFFWVRWCKLGQATLSVNDTATGVGQSYPITVVEPTPTPMPTATPTSTPTPGPLHDPIVKFTDLWGANTVRQRHPDRERQIRELPWVADGLLYTERQAAQGLVYLAPPRWGLLSQVHDTFLGR